MDEQEKGLSEQRRFLLGKWPKTSAIVVISYVLTSPFLLVGLAFASAPVASYAVLELLTWPLLALNSK